MGLTEGPGRGRQSGVLGRASRDLGPPGSPRQAGVGQSPEAGNGAGVPRGSGWWSGASWSEMTSPVWEGTVGEGRGGLG